MEIKRDIISVFKTWKDSALHKPILLKGARQIGKTWAMEKFGKECFKYCVKFDFDRQPELISIFQTTKSPERIISELALYWGQRRSSVAGLTEDDRQTVDKERQVGDPMQLRTEVLNL